MKVSKVMRFIPAFVWMGIIFYLSAQPAEESSELSSNAMQLILQFVGNIIAVDETSFHYMVRKGAHLSAYLLLAMLMMFATERGRMRGWSQAGFVMVICVLYAASDEVHQLFVPGRGGQLSDVGIDAIGALVGVVCYMIVRKGLRVFRA